MSEHKKQWNAKRPLRESEDYGVYELRHLRTTQTLELAPGRFVEIRFDPSTREYVALGLRGDSRLAVINKILDDWLLTESVEEVLGGRRELGEAA